MSKQKNIEVTGVITEALGSGNFRVELDNITGSSVLAQLSGKMRKFSIKVLPGDKVKMEMSPYDLTRGRIVSRLNPDKIKKEDETNVSEQSKRKTR